MVNFPEPVDQGKYAFEYYENDEGEEIGFSCVEWPYIIQRQDDEIAFVCKETNEPFGILNHDVFNTALICWLMVDCPDLLRQAARDSEG